MAEINAEIDAEVKEVKHSLEAEVSVKGEKGDPGESAYESALAGGFIGSQAEFYKWLGEAPKKLDQRGDDYKDYPNSMTGELTLAGNPTDPMHAVPKRDLDKETEERIAADEAEETRATAAELQEQERAEGAEETLMLAIEEETERAMTVESSKVDKIQGKGLSSEDYTAAEKEKLAGLESSHWKGLYSTLADLKAAWNDPAPEGGGLAKIGDYADTGNAGTEEVRYHWDGTDKEWVLTGGADMTPAEIKQEYESNPDTNAFTDTEKSKVSNLPEDTELAISGMLKASNKGETADRTISNGGTFKVLQTVANTASSGGGDVHERTLTLPAGFLEATAKGETSNRTLGYSGTFKVLQTTEKGEINERTMKLPAAPSTISTQGFVGYGISTTGSGTAKYFPSSWTASRGYASGFVSMTGMGTSTLVLKNASPNSLEISASLCVQYQGPSSAGLDDSAMVPQIQDSGTGAQFMSRTMYSAVNGGVRISTSADIIVDSGNALNLSIYSNNRTKSTGISVAYVARTV
jgi:hypothetical protein